MATKRGTTACAGWPAPSTMRPNDRETWWPATGAKNLPSFCPTLTSKGRKPWLRKSADLLENGASATVVPPSIPLSPWAWGWPVAFPAAITHCQSAQAVRRSALRCQEWRARPSATGPGVCRFL